MAIWLMLGRYKALRAGWRADAGPIETALAVGVPPSGERLSTSIGDRVAQRAVSFNPRLSEVRRLAVVVEMLVRTSDRRLKVGRQAAKSGGAKVKDSLDFGKIIAYLLPGFVGLWGLSHRPWTVARWFQLSENTESSFDNVSFILLGSLAFGVILSAFRWVIFDQFSNERIFCVPELKVDFSKLSAEHTRLALQLLIDNHYNYYQFYSAMAVAVPFAFINWCLAKKEFELIQIFYGVVVIVTTIVLSLGAADALKKYVKRTTALLGSAP